MKMKMKLVVFLALMILFASCKKVSSSDDTNTNCPAPDNISIGNSGPVIVGWPIEVSAPSNYVGYYNWFSPAGSPIDQSGFVTTNSYYYYKPVSTYADSGLYKLEITFDGCTRYRGTTQVKIIAPPTPPCSVTNNTSTSSVIGVGGVSYTSYTTLSNPNYIQVSGGGESINFRFPGNTKPRQGVYKTNGYIPSTETQVGCWIMRSPYDFVNMNGQDVYVNTVNGKMQISFCNAQFTNPLGTSVIRISAKITEP
jgi:hypothetical protein